MSYENGEWVEDHGDSRTLPGTLMFRDFLPFPDPDRSTCWHTAYQSFSETVQQANDWLNGLTGVEVVNCEALPFQSTTSPTYLPDSWPSTTHVRGVRVWLRILPETESIHGARLLLSYRDFSPCLDTKNLFSRDHEDATTVLHKVNEYLATRTSPARILSLQTVDTPLSGVLDLDVDTEKSRLTFPHHGFTKYCRSLRVFLVTQHHRNPKVEYPSLKHPKSHVTLHLMDFEPNSREITVGEVTERALAWCNSTPRLTLVNIQVLPLKVGRSTLASAWLLENPGHVINKFTSFVRVVYILGDDGDQVAHSSYPMGSHIHARSENSKEIGNTEKKEGGGEKREGETRKTLPPLRSELHQELENMHKEEESGKDHGTVRGADVLPGVVSVDGASPLPAQTHVGLHRKTFVPKVTTPGRMCQTAGWETVEETVARLNSWLVSSQTNVVSVHTSYVYIKGGDEVNTDAVTWTRHLMGCGQLAVMQLVMKGGSKAASLPTTTTTSHNNTATSQCAIL